MKRVEEKKKYVDIEAIDQQVLNISMVESPDKDETDDFDDEYKSHAIDTSKFKKKAATP
jgi:hypothetical protein